MVLVTANSLLTTCASSRGLIRVFFNVGPRLGRFRWLNALLFLNRLSVLFYFGFALLRGLLLLFVGRCLRADRQSDSKPDRS
jgi:hypothetical protein